MLEPIFMRVAGHKWLGRRMGLVVDVCGFCGLAWAGMNVGTVAEGVKTSSAIDKLSKEHRIYTPIAQEVKLILDGKNPKNSLKDLLKN